MPSPNWKRSPDHPGNSGLILESVIMSNDAADVDRGPLVVAGQVWLRKRGSAAVIRRVRAVVDGKVQYEVLHGPANLRRNKLGTYSLRSFLQHTRQIEEQGDYGHLDGARPFDTFLVLSIGGEPLLRCSQKRAQFYLKKGF